LIFEFDFPYIRVIDEQPSNKVYYGDSSQLAEEQALRNLSLAFNKQFGFLSCVDQKCGYILTENFMNHLKVHCRGKFVKEEEQNLISNLLSCFPPSTFEGSQPVQGLKIYHGYICSRCNSIAPKLPHLKALCRKAHRKEPCAPKSCQYQEKYKGKEKFEVSFPFDI